MKALFDWTPVIHVLLEGKTVRISGLASPNVTGRISSRPEIRGKYTVRVRTTPEGVVTWLDPKEETNKGNPFGRRRHD